MSVIDNLKLSLEAHEPRSIKENLPDAGILVPLTRHDRDPEIILTRRAQHMSTHQGQVAFPGGKFDESDGDTLQTALRESHEEIGLLPDQVEVIAPLSQVISLHGIRVSPYVGLVADDVELTPNQDELDSIFKVPVSFMLDAKPVRRDHMSYKGIKLAVPCFEYREGRERYEIWGLSSIVLVELLNTAFNANISIFE